MTAPVLQILVTSTPELCALTHPRTQSLQYFGQQLNPFAQQFKKPKELWKREESSPAGMRKRGELPGLV